MKKYKVTILPIGKEIFVEENTSLLDAQITAGLRPDAPCGGKGTCGKCLVEIITGSTKNVVKACQTLVQSDTVIRINEKNNSHHLLMDGVGKNLNIDPAIKSIWVKVEPPKVGNSDAEWERIKKSLSTVLNYDKKDYKIDISLLSDIYDMLIDNNYLINTILFNNEVIDFRVDKSEKYVMAFDIGTTSIVGYLLNLVTGEQVAVVSMLNPQTQYGADVIMRANYAIENGVEKLTDVVRSGLNELIMQAAKEANVDSGDIYLVSIVGNTCMHHLFLGISPKALVHAPYNPIISDRIELKAKDLNISINDKGRVLVLPNIAGFVGADTTGVLLATEFDRLEPLTLAIDIGTNGELVMGNREKMVACSTAAGPAFEGAKIKCGMRGKEGAIEHMKFVGEKMEYAVIGNVTPIGICGSGLMDIVASLIEVGIIDESGKLISPEDLTTPTAIANKDKLVNIGGEKVFVLYSSEEVGKTVFLSQRDIREVQLAKAAMAAGIELMSRELNIEIKDLKQVLIAGAFGNYMSPHSACKIGLIPEILEDRIIPIGNAAGEGSKMAALSYPEYLRSEEITTKVDFLELATNPEFEDCFIDHLGF